MIHALQYDPKGIGSDEPSVCQGVIISWSDQILVAAKDVGVSVARSRTSLVFFLWPCFLHTHSLWYAQLVCPHTCRQ